MVLSLRIKNYKSILDLTIPMTYAEKKAPNGYKQMELLPFLEEHEIRTIPALVLYGANASGKSTIVQAFASLVGIIRNRYIPKSVPPNALHPNNTITSFTLDFMDGGRRFLYVLEVDGTQIVTERLEESGQEVFEIAKRTTRFSNLSTEIYTTNKLETIFSVECQDQERQFRIPLISVVGKHYAGLNAFMAAAFGFMSNNLTVHSDKRIPFALGLSTLAKTDDEMGLQKAFADIVSILRKLDIDITRMEYKRDEVKDMYASEPAVGYEPHFDNTEIHSYHMDVLGNEVRFNFMDESAGTQRLACLLGLVLSALRTGTVLVIDELGNSLHPLLLAEIVRMFKDKRYNTSNAQLIFTTHNTDIMEQDMMRVSEIGFVNRTLKKGTMMNRVSDFQGIRNVTNFRKQYLQGTFSGIPYPYI